MRINITYTQATYEDQQICKEEQLLCANSSTDREHLGLPDPT